MKTILIRLLQYIKRWSIRKYKSQVIISADTKLLNGFGVNFFKKPQNQCYLRVGSKCFLSTSFVFEGDGGLITIGDRCYFGGMGSVICRERVEVGNDVTIAWGVTLYDHDSHSKDWRQRAKVVDHFYKYYGSKKCFRDLDWTGVNSAPITIKDNVWIGFDVVVLKGVTIGEGAIIGARSVVTKDVEPYTIVAGNPARFVKKI